MKLTDNTQQDDVNYNTIIPVYLALEKRFSIFFAVYMPFCFFGYQGLYPNKGFPDSFTNIHRGIILVLFPISYLVLMTIYYRLCSLAAKQYSITNKLLLINKWYFLISFIIPGFNIIWMNLLLAIFANILLKSMCEKYYYKNSNRFLMFVIACGNSGGSLLLSVFGFSSFYIILPGLIIGTTSLLNIHPNYIWVSVYFSQIISLMLPVFIVHGYFVQDIRNSVWVYFFTILLLTSSLIEKLSYIYKIEKGLI